MCFHRFLEQNFLERGDILFEHERKQKLEIPQKGTSEDIMKGYSKRRLRESNILEMGKKSKVGHQWKFHMCDYMTDYVTLYGSLSLNICSIIHYVYTYIYI